MSCLIINILIHKGLRGHLQGGEGCDVSDGDKQDCGVMGTTQVHVRQFFVSLFSHHFPGLVMGTTQVYVLLILVYYSTGQPRCRIRNLWCIIVHFYFTLTNYCSFGDDLSAQKKSCTVANNNHSKQDLGSQKPTLSFQEQCEGSGCCWRPVSSTEKVFQRKMSHPQKTFYVFFFFSP